MRLAPGSNGVRRPRRRRAAATVLTALVAASLALASVGCGGGLKYTVDDAALDPLPPNDRQGVAEARREAEIAEEERRSTALELEEVARETDLAKKEKEQARLEVEKIVSEQEGAKVSRDENQANAAARNKDVADLGLKVAESKIAWLRQKKDWLEQSHTAAEAHGQAARARVEFEKAKVAQQKGMKPGNDFDPTNFERQWQGKHADWQSEKADAEAERKETTTREERWKHLTVQFQKLKGG